MQDVIETVLGLDVSDRKTDFCELSMATGDSLARGTFATTVESVESFFGGRDRSLVILEIGKQSPWMTRAIRALGHEVIAANPRKLALIYRSARKSDRLDAARLARLGRFDIELLFPVHVRKQQTQQDLCSVRARDSVVSCRTKLVNMSRGMAKSLGRPLPKCAAKCFANVVRKEGLPEGLEEALGPVVELIAELTQKIKDYDKLLEAVAQERYPQIELLRQVRGVGIITSMTYALVIEDSKRFKKSRDVGPYVGFVPKLGQSGNSDPDLRISREGDQLLRKALTQSAQYMLGPFGEDCNLRRHGERILERGGKRAKRRAVIAVARKLGVLLHRLWASGEVYDRFYGQDPSEELLTDKKAA